MTLASTKLEWRSLPPEAKQQFLEELRRRQGSRVSIAFKRRYRNDPLSFVHDCFNWRENENPAPYQDEILSENHKREAIRAPHSGGKTTLAAWKVLHFALTRDGDDWKCITTASSHRQLSKYLWPEIHKWARRLKWEKIGRPMFDKRTELQTLSLKLGTGEAFAAASDNPALIEGAHADEILYIFDEAKAIPESTFDAAEGAFAGGAGTEAFAFALSTPGEPTGRFYDIHRRRPGLEDWHVRHITLRDAIAAGRISAQWAEQRKKQWGSESAVYKNRVLGDFAASAEDCCVPLSWIEAANERWEEWKESGDWLPFTCVSADIARSDDGDKTSLGLRHSHVLTELRRYQTADTMIVTGHIAGILRARPGGYGIVDVIGVGGGPVDRLREQKFTIVAFNASESTDKKDLSLELGFINKRSAAWYGFRELLDPANGSKVAIPPDDLLIGDLTAPHWRVTSAGKIQVEGKDDHWLDGKGNKMPSIRQRLGRSTDDGDTTVMAFFEEPVRGDRYTEADMQSYSTVSY